MGTREAFLHQTPAWAGGDPVAAFWTPREAKELVFTCLPIYLNHVEGYLSGIVPVVYFGMAGYLPILTSTTELTHAPIST